MKDQEFCHICGSKIKGEGLACKKCNADPSEKIVADCRAMQYANSFIISAYVNLVLTDRRLLAFEDIKGAISAGAQAGLSQGGAIGDTVASFLGNPTERVVAKGVNGSKKFEAPLSSIVSVETENTKKGMHTFINVTDSKKPLRVVLGTSFDGEITGDLFKEILINTACPG